MDLSIVIPTLNRLDTLLPCINSIQRNTSIEYEIIVYANECTELTFNSLCFLDGVKVIADKQNSYYTQAINRAATRAQGDYLFLLNDDCLIQKPDWLITYKNLIELDSSIAVVGPFWHNIDALPYGWIEPYAAMFPRQIFEHIGGLPYFDDSFVLWWSDIYFAYKAMQMGYYTLPVQPELIAQSVHHLRPTGDHGDTVKRFQSILRPECFEFHGKTLMYKRLDILNESGLTGYYASKVWGCSDYDDID
ncbi:MAG: GT2 family glycosyltransferase [Parasphingorhabdus sp.]|jgi:GT2 family glycosyltransferase